MGFTRVAPQVAQHTDGYRVQIGGRYFIEYIDGDAIAKVTADLEGPTVLIHRRSVAWVKPNERAATEEETNTILTRVVDGMSALGDSCEILDR